MELAGIGVSCVQLRNADASESAEAAAELEELGFTALWIPGVGGPVFDVAHRLLSATTGTVIATGIMNLWMHSPGEVAASYAALATAYGDRFLLGIGGSQPGPYRNPALATAAFLDALDAAEQPVPAERRVIIAQSPKMLALAASRARGAHPYLVTPEHTAVARAALGEASLLLPMQTVILCDSADEARTIGSCWLRAYLAASPSYADNLLRRSGLSADDLAQMSDRLLDGIIVWGDEEAVMRRVAEHKSAGADHVCVQVLTADPSTFPREEWRRIAAAYKG
ncbi:LLM class F420-dependent oxidoreductase [Mycobacterium alsense]|uniref:LLM class F420-dependent oxidoreductase n=1 Tax=Mycobacterium alsense TaxID=324058 RepID=A0AA41XN66_9MYCO|nr:TIGR03620 family F420-dependent LLM class oxidoreductase [Mycobacterium alsense]MCV7379176.1 TIGR03620 family F420-dependent LLM class oxidoreductase [Mycobacterium alsense]OQZ89895.1 LLM class F420-dependent oxidoreductase [Mycobacterium alsense]